jgi:hypothetical protein
MSYRLGESDEALCIMAQVVIECLWKEMQILESFAKRRLPYLSSCLT